MVYGNQHTMLIVILVANRLCQHFCMLTSSTHGSQHTVLTATLDAHTLAASTLQGHTMDYGHQHTVPTAILVVNTIESSFLLASVATTWQSAHQHEFEVRASQYMVSTEDGMFL